MGMMNTAIKYVANHGLGESVFDALFFVTFIFIVIFMNWYRKKYGISVGCFLAVLLVLYPLGYLWIYFYAWMESGFSHWGISNAIYGYVYYPVFLLPITKLFRTKIGMLTDYAAPGLVLQQSILRFCCVFRGCCRGYPSAQGLWNGVTQGYVFPIQMVESAVGLLIFLFLFRTAEKRKYIGDGKLYAEFLILYGGAWFLTQFLRDNVKWFWGISKLALHGAFMAVIGIAWLISINRKLSSEKS